MVGRASQCHCSGSSEQPGCCLQPPRWFRRARRTPDLRGPSSVRAGRSPVLPLLAPCCPVLAGACARRVPEPWPGQRRLWGVGGGLCGTLGVRCLHWSCRAGGRAGVPAGGLQVQGGPLPQWYEDTRPPGTRKARPGACEHDAGAVTPAPGHAAGRLQERPPGPPQLQAAPGDGSRGSAAPSFIGSSSSLLLIESSNIEKKMSFCQIRWDSLWSLSRSARTQRQPSRPALPPAGPPGSAVPLVWAWPSCSCHSQPPSPDAPRAGPVPPRSGPPAGSLLGLGTCWLSLCSPRPRLEAPGGLHPRLLP